MRTSIRRHAAGLAFAAAAGWALLILSAPLLASGRAGRAGVGVAAAAYLAGSVVCHQQPLRSFHIGAAQLPVCARCTGLYLAGALGIGLTLAVRRRRQASRLTHGLPPRVTARKSPVTRLSWRAILILAASPMLLSVGLEWAGAWAGSNALRAVTGLPAGWAVGALVVESLSFRGKL